MTPVELLIIVAAILIARIVMSVPAIVARTSGRSSHIAHEYLDPFIVAGIAAWFLISYVARTYYIPSASMVPTLEIGDVLLVDKFEYRFHSPNEGDIVVFPPPMRSSDDFIKRVIGLPGQTFRVTGGVVYANGKRLVEPYTDEPPNPNFGLQVRNYDIYVNFGDGWQPLEPSQANIPPRSMWTAPNRIPPHCYIMFGDNRNNSEDSRYWGFAQDSGRFASGPLAGQPAGFTGRAFVIFWPPSQVRFLHG